MGILVYARSTSYSSYSILAPLLYATPAGCCSKIPGYY